MERKFIIFVLIMLILLLGACKRPEITQVKQDPVITNKTISITILNLEELGVDGNLTEEDLSKLDGLIKGDDKAIDEVSEIRVLVKYNEYAHAVHALEFLREYLLTKKVLLCPGHALSHYYVFIKHNESSMATDAFNELEDQMPGWVPRLEDQLKLHPNGERAEDILNFLDRHFSQIENGNNNITEDELLYLDDKASVCIYT